MPSFSKGDGNLVSGGNKTDASSKHSKMAGAEHVERLVSGDSPFAPPKTKPGIGVEGFGKDTSTKVGTASSGFRRRDEVNIYADEVREHGGMDRRKRVVIMMIVMLVVLLPLVLILPYGLLDNGWGITPGAITASFARNVHDLIALLIDPANSGSEEVIASKYLCIIIAGAALGVTGAVYQGALKNSLASPTTLGVDSGATTGAAVFLLALGGSGFGFVSMSMSQVTAKLGQLSPLQYIWVLYGKAICALIGAFIVVFLVLLIAKVAGRGRTSGLWIIVTGAIVSTLFSSFIYLISYYFAEMGLTEQEDMLENISAQAFTNISSFVDVLIVGIPILLCLIPIFSRRTKLGLLTFGDDEARSMGIDPNRLRNGMIAITTVMTAVITAFCGNIGFLGFMVPHITRRFIGSDFRYLLPASALTGALVLLIAYYAMSFFSSGASDYVGLITAVIGFVVFVVMFNRQGVQKHVREN